VPEDGYVSADLKSHQPTDVRDHSITFNFWNVGNLHRRRATSLPGNGSLIPFYFTAIVLLVLLGIFKLI
jgi:hypothetical protein